MHIRECGVSHDARASLTVPQWGRLADTGTRLGHLTGVATGYHPETLIRVSTS